MNSEQTKVLLLGDRGVGKTSIIYQFVNATIRDEYGSVHEDEYRRTIVVDGVRHSLSIMDPFEGENDSQEVFSRYCRSAKCVILVYSINNQNSFDKIEHLRDEVLRVVDAPSFPIIICGNKSDLTEQRVVSEEQRERLSFRFVAPSIETSALLGANIHELFEMAVRRFAHHNKAYSAASNSDPKDYCSIS